MPRCTLLSGFNVLSLCPVSVGVYFNASSYWQNSHGMRRDQTLQELLSNDWLSALTGGSLYVST